MEDVRLLQVVELVRATDEVARREAAVGQVVEEHVVRHQPRHGHHAPAGEGAQLLGQRLEVGDAGPVQIEGVQPLQEGVAGAAGQHLRLPLVERHPGGVLLGGVGVPPLRDGPVRSRMEGRGERGVAVGAHGARLSTRRGGAPLVAAARVAGEQHVRLRVPHRSLAVGQQVLLGDIGGVGAVRVLGEQVVEGLVLGRADLLGDRPPPLLRVGEGGVHVEDHAPEREQSVPDHLADLESRGLGVHDASMTRAG